MRGTLSRISDRLLTGSDMARGWQAAIKLKLVASPATSTHYQRIFYGSAVLSSTQGSSGELLTTRVPPFCPLVHAFTVHVLAGSQYEERSLRRIDVLLSAAAAGACVTTKSRCISGYADIYRVGRRAFMRYGCVAALMVMLSARMKCLPVICAHRAAVLGARRLLEAAQMSSIRDAQ